MKKRFITMLLQICNGIAIELQRHILQRVIVVVNLLQRYNINCNGIVMKRLLVYYKFTTELQQL